MTEYVGWLVRVEDDTRGRWELQLRKDDLERMYFYFQTPQEGLEKAEQVFECPIGITETPLGWRLSKEA